MSPDAWMDRLGRRLVSEEPALSIMRQRLASPWWLVGMCLAFLAGGAFGGTAWAEALDLSNRPIAQVNFEGLVQVSEQLARNNVQAAVGEPYDPEVVRTDVIRLNRLGRFRHVDARVAQRADGSLVLTYVVDEFPLLADVQVVGNKRLGDQELLDAALLRPGDPASEYLINGALRRLERAYEDEGYYFTSVEYDEQVLAQSGVLILSVREGPRVRVRGIAFEGNDTFRPKQLRQRITSKVHVPIFTPGVMSREVLDSDVNAIREFYVSSGFLDVRVGRRIDMSPDQTEAVVTFVIEEGRRYTLSGIEIVGARVFSEAQIIEAIPLKVGDVYEGDAVEQSTNAVRDLYHKLGYVRVRVQADELFDETRPQVGLRLTVAEDKPYITGTVTILGNDLTKDKVVYRQLRDIAPGRVLDGTGIEASKRQMNRSQLFGQAQITLIDNEANPDVLDVLVEVEEQNTGNLSFGVGVSSDLGVAGSIELTQRNFDIADTPESAEELFRARAFRGAGQYFRLLLQPGNENSRYAIDFAEPALFESDFSLSTGGFLIERERDDFDEQRAGASVGVGRRFGDIWSARTAIRLSNIDISNIAADGPTDVFAVQGTTFLVGVELSVTRTTLDSPVLPTTGSSLTLAVEQVAGDFEFTKLEGRFSKYWTIDRDFLNRPTIVSVRLNVGYIVPEDEAPVFERYFAGGHRTFRGFDFRGVGPRGIRNDNGMVSDDAVGGDFLFLLGVEYSYPMIEELLRGVVFVDSGTVQDDIGLDEYRVSAGAGLRLLIKGFSPVPIALDFAWPLSAQDGDERQVFSFDVALPFR